MDPRFKKSLTEPKIPGFEWQEPEDPGDRDIFRDILTYGCSVLCIEGDPTAPNLRSEFAYSIGFYLNLSHPELLLMGISGDAATRMMNSLFSYVETGKTIRDGDGVRHDFGAGELRLVAKLVPQRMYHSYLGYACWFYRSLLFKIQPIAEHKFPVLQLCWPDKAGNYPWEPECNANVRRAQTLVAT